MDALRTPGGRCGDSRRCSVVSALPAELEIARVDQGSTKTFDQPTPPIRQLHEWRPRNLMDLDTGSVVTPGRLTSTPARGRRT